jgi:hypothetical protein
MAIKRLALCNHDPGGIVISPNHLILETTHLRSDASRSGDLYAVARVLHAKDASMDVVICSSISKSCYIKLILKLGFCSTNKKNEKFSKDLRNPEPLQQSATQRFIPLALNQCGRRGPNCEAILREHASIIIKRSSGCRMLKGPFAIPLTMALAKILSS